MNASKNAAKDKQQEPYDKKPDPEHCPPDQDGRPDPKPPRRPKRPTRFDPCRTPPASPYLVIRSFAEDLGVRPVPAGDAGGLAYSPDIPFVPEVTPDGSIILQCWITNIGLGPAAPVQIEFFLLPPSITSPGPAPFLVATEHAIISPHTSKLIKTRPLSFPNPFGGGLAQGVLVRCSTPFDRHSGTLDPVQDRHVAVMNAWPITDQAPDVSLGLSNLTAEPSTARVDIAVHKIRLRSVATGGPSVRSRFIGNDLLQIGERPLRVADHIATAEGLKPRHQKVFRRALNGQRELPVSAASLTPVAGANELEIEAKLDDTPRRFFPTSDFMRQSAAVGRGCELPENRRSLVSDISLDAFEERQLRLKIAPTGRLRGDEYFAVHLFHVDPFGNRLFGRVCLILGKQVPKV